MLTSFLKPYMVPCFVEICSYMSQLIVVVALALQGANLIGYFKCQKDAQARLTKVAGQYVGQTLLNYAGSAMFGPSPSEKRTSMGP